MRKSHIILIVIALALLSAFFYYLYRAEHPVSRQTVPQETETPSAPDAISIAPEAFEHASSTYAEMQLSYPKSDATHLKEIYAYVQSQKNGFWGQYGAVTADEAKQNFMREDDPYQLYIDFRAATSSKTVSYILETYQYLGGAHGGTAVNSFTYDAAGKLLSEKDVFTGDYLSVVAPMARQYFYDTLGEYAQPDAIDNGTEATSTNYSVWYLTDTSVVFVFGEYQVGPYVIGIQEYPVDKSKIASVLAAPYR
jgi:hypothetical protein